MIEQTPVCEKINKKNTFDFKHDIKKKINQPRYLIPIISNKLHFSQDS